MSSLLKFWNQGPISDRWLLGSDGGRSGSASPAGRSRIHPDVGAADASVPLPSQLERISGKSVSTLERYQSDIQRRFQALLDIQAEKLLTGTNGKPIDSHDVSDTASSAGASTDVSRYGKVMPVRQPDKQDISLRAARKEIGIALGELATVKGQERSLYTSELRKRQDELAQLRAWKDRQEGLSRQIEEIKESESSSRLEALRREDKSLLEQITILENQLMELKGQQRAMKLELSRAENSMQSKLSSYTESLNIIEDEVNQFLDRTPQSSSRFRDEESAYLTLPRSRRSLNMALDHTEDEIASLKTRQNSSQDEIEAAMQGRIVWRDVVKAVTELERHLRQNMSKKSSESQTYQEKDADAGDSMVETSERIDQAILDLRSKLQLAEVRGWKLLVCCIGAELEALKQARSVLKGSFSIQTSHNDTMMDDLDMPHSTGYYSSSVSARAVEGVQETTETEPISFDPDALRQSWANTDPKSAHHSDQFTASRRFSAPKEDLDSLQPENDQRSSSLHIAQDEFTSNVFSSTHRSETVGELPVRRSFDSYRRRNEKGPLRIYRPEDDEPAPDLLVAEPEYNDIE